MRVSRIQLRGLRRLAESFPWVACAVGLFLLGNIIFQFARDEMLATRGYSAEVELWLGALFAFLAALFALMVFAGGLIAVYLGTSLLNKQPKRKAGGVLHDAANDLVREEGTATLDTDSERNPKNEWVLKMLRGLPTEHYREE